MSAEYHGTLEALAAVRPWMHGPGDRIRLATALLADVGLDVETLTEIVRMAWDAAPEADPVPQKLESMLSASVALNASANDTKETA